MTYHRVCTKSNMMGVTCVAETAYPAGAPGISLRFFIYLSGFRVVHVLKLHVFTFFVPVLLCSLRFPSKKLCSIRLVSQLFCRCSCFIYVICIYLRILVSNTISLSDDVRVV